MWQEWKKRNIEAQQAGRVTPSALFNPDSPQAGEELQSERYDICRDCPKFMATKQCSECFCFMPTKTWLLHATCPLGKW